MVDSLDRIHMEAINYSRTKNFEYLRAALAKNPPLVVPTETERCRRLASSSKFIAFDWQNFNSNWCNYEEFDNITKFCSGDVPIMYFGTAVTKKDTSLLEAINRVVPFLYIHALKFQKDEQRKSVLRESKWNQKSSISMTFSIETISALLILYLIGHLCSFLALITERIVFCYHNIKSYHINSTESK